MENPFSNFRLVDLTRTIDGQMPGVQFEQARRLEVDGWNARTLHLYSHAGTHMDAPLHFGVSDETIDKFSPERFFGKTWIARVENVTSRQQIFPEDIGSLGEHILPGENLIIHTGWSRIGDPKKFRNELPRISEELARWCVDKKINMLGVEPPSVADVNNLSEVTTVHHMLMNGNVIIVEGLVNLELIESDYVWLIALPLKLHDGDGSPIRAIALEPLNLQQ